MDLAVNAEDCHKLLDVLKDSCSKTSQTFLFYTSSRSKPRSYSEKRKYVIS